jgi:hypothetical protein
LKEIDCGMLQPEEKLNYLIYLYKHQLGKVLILDEVVDVTVKDKKIAGWIVTIEEQLMKLNLGNERDLKEVLINAILPTYFQAQTKELLVNYCDVLTWSYKDLKGIPKEISILEILSFTTNHYATCMQLVVVCNYLGHVCNYKFGIVKFLGHTIVCVTNV